RGLTRLLLYWKLVLCKPKADFLHSLGLTDGESFLDINSMQDINSIETSTVEASKFLILFELKKLVRSSRSFSTFETFVEKALMQYKLGIEVMTPEIIDSLKNKKELLLQKELCRFLLERNIFTVGTKFGRSETDLLAELPTEGYIIETKIYKEGRRVNERIIKSNLVQLQSYMDQSPIHRKGILVIYNFSSILITAPRYWLRGRFLLLPINLQTKPPSSRQRSLIIEPGEGEDLIRVLNIKPPGG
ncbi:hypothetical protein JYT87_02520, partial [Nitrospira defluvii]|nr:hypothetical protein [Nitrospira defluvii]